MATTYTNYGSVYGNTADKMAEIETALNAAGLSVAYNDDGQNGVIIKAITSTDTNNLIAGTPAPEAVAEPVTEEEATEDSTDEETADSE